MRQHPKVNSSWQGDTIRINHHIHIGVAIAVDETGSVYIADSGKDNKDSKVIKFSAAIDVTPGMSQSMNNGYNSSSYGANSYSSYSNTRNGR